MTAEARLEHSGSNDPSGPTPPEFTPSMTDVSASQAPTRLLQLDGVRGLAALAVFAFHLFAVYPHVFETSIKPLAIARVGSYGVHVFFMVSGFVILMTLDRCVRPSDFVIGRVARLYPTYWTAVAISVATIATGIFPDSVVTQHVMGARQSLINFSMFQAFFNVHHVDGSYWTLSYEVAFYGWAFLLFACGQRARAEHYAAAYVVFATALFAALDHDVVHLGGRLQVLLLLGYGHLFVAGMMFYQLQARGGSPARYAIIALACVAHIVEWGLLPSVAVIAAVSMFYALYRGRLGWLGWGPIAWLGSISYALYVVQEVPGWGLMRLLRSQGVNYWVASSATVVAAITVAWGLTRFVERPGMAALKGSLLRLREGWDAREHSSV